MSCLETGPSSTGVRTQCPDCTGKLAVMRVISGRGGSNYWMQRCVSCGGIHLDIVRPEGPEDESGAGT